MRRRLLSTLFSAVLLSGLIAAVPAAATAEPVGAGTIAIAETTAPVAPETSDAADVAAQTSVYRFWSPQNQTHFYTTNVAERNKIISQYPTNIWTYEGPRFQAFSSQQPGTVPLYRFWSPRLSGHFFTANEAEKNSVVNDYDDFTWTYEGVAYYVYPTSTDVPATVPVARFWSPTNQHHFYTASAQETEVVKRYPAAIWSYEGINFRVPASIEVDIPATPPQYVAPVYVPPVVVAPPVVIPPVVTPPAPAYYANCAAVRAAGKAPLYRGQPGYSSSLDRDGDGVACE